MWNCTGAEMMGFGHGFVRIAEAVGAERLVGEALTNAEVAKLLSLA
jgi:hypothetical protein